MPMLACALACLLSACAAAGPPTTAKPAAHTSGAQTPAAQTSAPQTAKAWLDRIDRATARLKTLTATVRYDRVQNLLGDRQRRFGELVYAAGGRGDQGPPPRFSIHFDRLVLGRKLRRINQWYIYDGRWLLERDGDDHTATRRELSPARPPGHGRGHRRGHKDASASDSGKSPQSQRGRRFMRLGEGPFALPLDQDKRQLLARFHVRLAASADGDPKNTIHLVLTPKPGLKLDQKRIDLWYDRDTLLPIRAHSVDKDQSESTFTLLHPKINPRLPDTSFDTALPTGSKWQTQTIPLPASDSKSP